MHLTDFRKKISMTQQRGQNQLQSIVLFMSLATVAIMVSYITAGLIGLIICFLLITVNTILKLQMSSRSTMQSMGARILQSYEYPALFEMRNELCKNAGLEYRPDLYIVPGNMMNAFAVGDSQNSAVAFSERMFRSLDIREISAVLAHEIAHIRNHDVRLMSLSDGLYKMTYNLCQISQFIIFFMIPLWVFGFINLNLSGIVFLMLAPILAVLIYLALSRTREMEADRTAAILSGDPEGLALALTKLSSENTPWWSLIFSHYPIAHDHQIPTYLKTHPPTSHRIKKLQSYPSQPTLLKNILRKYGSTRSLSRSSTESSTINLVDFILKQFRIRI